MAEFGPFGDWLFVDYPVPEVTSHHTPPLPDVTGKQFLSDIATHDFGEKRRPGPISKTDQHPEIPGLVTDFISQHSTEAHVRRRTDFAYSYGVSLKDIRTFLLKTIPGLNISVHTIHRLMIPPRKDTIQASRFKSLVKAKVPKTSNNLRKFHTDAHYAAAQVSYTAELTTLCGDECVMFSCDDKAKVNVGTAAVSRFYEHTKFFPKDKQPDLVDHDFPYANAKIVPSGYMELRGRQRRSHSLPPDGLHLPDLTQRKRYRSISPRKRSLLPDVRTQMDKRGRKHVSWPRTGPLNVYLAAQKFHKSTSASHMEHLKELLEPIVHDRVSPKSVVTIIADGGPDWSMKSIANFINLGRLWKDLKLDGLVQTSYAPSHSAYNPIERAWAPLSRQLAGVILPYALEGEVRPPSLQTGLTPAEIRDKDALAFNRATTILANYWKITYDGFPVSPRCVPCITEDNSDHSALLSLGHCTQTKLVNDPQMASLREEYKFLVRHSVRRRYHTEFYKCDSSDCQHCVAMPVRAVKFFNILEQFSGRLPEPVVSVGRSYRTVLDLLARPQSTRNIMKLDENLPSSVFGRCQQGCRYATNSQADSDRHTVLMHKKLRPRTAPAQPTRRPAVRGRRQPVQRGRAARVPRCARTVPVRQRVPRNRKK